MLGQPADRENREHSRGKRTGIGLLMINPLEPEKGCELIPRSAPGFPRNGPIAISILGLEMG